MRTQEQLGYIVKSSYKTVGYEKNKYTIYEFLIQSNVKDYKYLENRIKDFVSIEILKIINNTETKDFKEIKESIKEKLLTPFNNLIDSSMYYFDKISNKNFLYDFNRLIGICIDDIKIDDLEIFYKKYFDLSKYVSISLIKN